VTFELHGGIPAVRKFVAGLQCFSLAESLGGVESLIAHPASMTHAAMCESARHAAGLTDGLLRLSVGIEACEDLRTDLAAALSRVELCGAAEPAAEADLELETETELASTAVAHAR
jgi:cystathionine gamma-synthase